MRHTKEVNLENRKVLVKELTVSEMRNWLKNLEGIKDGEIDLISEGLLEEASLSDVVLMTDLTMDDLDGMVPSELATLVDACKETNPHFFTLRDRLVQASRHMANPISQP